MLDHDHDGKLIEWNALDQRRRHRKALRDSMIAFILILMGWILLIIAAEKAKGQEIALGTPESHDLGSEPLPAAPVPKIEATPVPARAPIGVGRFWNRPNRAAAVGMFSIATADMAQTCRFLARGERERWLTQSCGANVSLTAGFTAGALLGAYALHRSGHHRLERLPMLYMAAASARGIVMSKRWGGW